MGVDPADEPLTVPYLAVHGFLELTCRLERGGVIFRLDPLGSPDLSRPIEAVDPI
jgi:hypothetical protein